MNRESQEIQELFQELCSQPKLAFPQSRQSINAPTDGGVYIIRKDARVLHVGRTQRGANGLNQRLKNHLHGTSSFTIEYLKGDGDILRQQGYTYQYLVVRDTRKRALLEAYTQGMLCPEHLGTGE